MNAAPFGWEITLPSVTRAIPVVMVLSPDDGPRGEIYKRPWRPLAAGKGALPKRNITLTIETLTKPGGDVIPSDAVNPKREE